MDRFFEEYQKGEPFERIVSNAVSIAENALNNHPDFNLNVINDYEQMKGKLSLEVVSSERNAELLNSVPHKNIEDMAVIYRFVLENTESGRASILVTNEMLDKYGIAAEQLHNDAMKIAPEIRPAEIKSFSETMTDILGSENVNEAEINSVMEDPFYIASVPDKMMGASVLAYQDFMDQAAERLGGDFYILPSSIHEILLIKDNGLTDRNMLEKMVRDVNSSVLDPEDKLTDSVYHYDSKDKIFELAEKFDERKMDRGIKSQEKGSVIADLKAKKEKIAKQQKKDAVEKSTKARNEVKFER